MSDPLCAAPRCRPDGEPRQTAGQAHLCPPCWTGLERHVAELPHWHDQLATVLQPATGGGDPVTRKGHDPNMALRFDVAELRGNIAGTLASWCRLVAEDRGVGQPERVDVNTLAVWLGRHVGWLAHQPFAGEVAGEMRALHGHARGVCYPRDRRRFSLPRPCPECAGRLLAAFDADDGLLPASVECDTGHVWAPRQWLALGRAIHGRDAA